jgi:hypothetical protein
MTADVTLRFTRDEGADCLIGRTRHLDVELTPRTPPYGRGPQRACLQASNARSTDVHRALETPLADRSLVASMSLRSKPAAQGLDASLVDIECLAAGHSSHCTDSADPL